MARAKFPKEIQFHNDLSLSNRPKSFWGQIFIRENNNKKKKNINSWSWKNDSSFILIHQDYLKSNGTRRKGYKISKKNPNQTKNKRKWLHNSHIHPVLWHNRAKLSK